MPLKNQPTYKQRIIYSNIWFLVFGLKGVASLLHLLLLYLKAHYYLTLQQFKKTISFYSRFQIFSFLDIPIYGNRLSINGMTNKCEVNCT